MSLDYDGGKYGIPIQYCFYDLKSGATIFHFDTTTDDDAELFGSWNEWKEGILMDRASDKMRVTGVYLKPGFYQYKFKFPDGGSWIKAGSENICNDGNGHINNFVNVPNV